MRAMKRSWIVLLFVAMLTALPQGVQAQEASDLMSQGITAFREGRYEAAARAFEQAAERDPQNAQAHFLLARVYAETPLKDRRKAERALDRALEIEPDNLSFLVGRLQQLREETTNYFAERIAESKRMELAERILRHDSTNAFAHEELGRTYIHDFWRYRNAIMLPTLRFTNSSTSSSRVIAKSRPLGTAPRQWPARPIRPRPALRCPGTSASPPPPASGAG